MDSLNLNFLSKIQLQRMLEFHPLAITYEWNGMRVIREAPSLAPHSSLGTGL